jgi:hypothetical protein
LRSMTALDFGPGISVTRLIDGTAPPLPWAQG